MQEQLGSAQASLDPSQTSTIERLANNFEDNLAACNIYSNVAYDQFHHVCQLSKR